jgi:hypothetical protein
VGNTASVSIEDRIGPEELFAKNEDKMFYSLLVQSGYLSLESLSGALGVVSIPNVELREVWERFLLDLVIENKKSIFDLLINIGSPTYFAQELATFLKPMLEGLSYFDLAKKQGQTKSSVRRRFTITFFSMAFSVCVATI